MRDYFLYSLNDPRSNEPKYIGITNNCERRLWYHLNDNASTKKTKWIKELKDQNLTPTINVLFQTQNVHEVISKEIEYISIYSINYELVNTTKGGEYYAIGTPIDQYDMQGIYIDSYASMIEACECLNIKSTAVSGISANCLRKRTHAYNYIWRYAGDVVTKEDLDKMNASIEHSKPKQIHIYDLDGNYIKTYNSIADAAREGYSRGSIARMLNGSKGKKGLTCGNNHIVVTDHKDVDVALKAINDSKPRKVKQYTLEGVYIQTHNSMSDAARAIDKYSSLNVIRACCYKKYKQGLGYIWTFEDEDDVSFYLNKSDGRATSDKYWKPINQYDLNGNLIHKFKSTKEAAEQLNCNIKMLRSAANGSKKTYKGFIWKYAV